MLYFYLFLVSFLLSLFLNFLAKKAGHKYRLFDEPRGDILKIHKQPVPFTGGFAMLGVFVLILSVSWLLKTRGFLVFDTNKLLTVILGAVLAFGYGLGDDLKWHRTTTIISQKGKLLIQVALGVIVAILLVLGQVYWHFIPHPFVSLVVSLIYFLVIFNAVNIQDGLDGLLGGIAFIAIAGFLIVSLLLSDVLGILLVVILLGSILGFLFYNWQPASIFMGNGGSQFLGFMMTFFAIYYTIKSYSFSWLFGPLLIVGVPLLNILFVVWRRLANRQSIFQADRHHLYDEILAKIGSSKKTVLINYLIQIILVALGLFLIKQNL